MPRKQYQRRTTPDRRREILRAALACFVEQGVEATTLADIRRRADASTGSLYHHFGNKAGIAHSLFTDGLQALNEDLLQRLQRCRAAKNGVRTVVLQYCDWVTAHPDMASFILSARDLEFGDDARAELKAMREAHLAAVFRWFVPHVRSGAMKQLPEDTYVPLISGPVQDYARAWVSGRSSRSLLEVKALFADAAWNAVRGDLP